MLFIPTTTQPTITPGVGAIANASQNSQYTARIALDAATREHAYALRYRSYNTGGFIASSDSGLFCDKYDEMTNTQTIVIYQDDVAVASVRVSLLVAGSAMRSPGADTYDEAVSRLLKEASLASGIQGRALEITRLVRSPSAQNNHGLVFLLYRLAGYIGMMRHVHLSFACVRENHVPFYRRLGFKAETDFRPYPGLNCMMQLMSSSRQRFDETRAAFPLIDPFTRATTGLEGFLSGHEVGLSLGRP